MPRLTPEEKQQRAKERADERLEGRRLYPYGCLIQFEENIDSWLDIRLPSGERDLEIVQHGKVNWYKDGDGHNANQIHSVSLRDLDQLLGFIRALISRYNAAIDELNQKASKLPAIKKPTRLPLPNLPGTEGAQIT